MNEQNKKLLEAAQFNRVCDIIAALDAGADVNAVDESGRTALIVAVTYGNEDVVKLLMESKANLDVKNEKGETAFLIAFHNGHLNVLHELFKHEDRYGEGMVDIVESLGFFSRLNFYSSIALNALGYEHEVFLEHKVCYNDAYYTMLGLPRMTYPCHIEYSTFLPPIVICAIGIIPLAMVALVKDAYKAIKGGEAAKEADVPAR